MQEHFLLIIISTLLFCSSIYCASEEACANQTNTDCGTCLFVESCGFCKTTKRCFLYDPEDILTPIPCATTDDLQWKTCVEMFEGVCGFQWEMIEYYRNFRVWIIIVAVLAGIVLLTALIVICCFCQKCKRCRIRREERRQDRRQNIDDQRMEERRAAAEIRTTERNRVADQIRMKYGILKEKDTGTDYARMS